ncbi:hypothetical protein AAL_07734 [Moelleriella libera RCEF 2490]|uniref:Uncharacterized protein n=1 Tax=Moelleriella libera RCEF 2490 TaxID=1081109 RepID=A0A167WYS7_9HYPO|nr:hypothetical protein AAL_07734 [Moelleriella libera RCEF 2490]
MCTRRRQYVCKHIVETGIPCIRPPQRQKHCRGGVTPEKAVKRKASGIRSDEIVWWRDKKDSRAACRKAPAAMTRKPSLPESMSVSAGSSTLGSSIDEFVWWRNKKDSRAACRKTPAAVARKPSLPDSMSDTAEREAPSSCTGGFVWCRDENNDCATCRKIAVVKSCGAESMDGVAWSDTTLNGHDDSHDETPKRKRKIFTGATICAWFTKLCTFGKPCQRQWDKIKARNVSDESFVCITALKKERMHLDQPPVITLSFEPSILKHDFAM